MNLNKRRRRRYHRKTSTISSFYKYIMISIVLVLILRFVIMNTSVYYRQTIMWPFSFHLTKQDLYIKKGEEYRLAAYGAKGTLSYKSTNFRVVGVNFNGRLHGYQTGKAYIIVKSGNEERKCRVHVIDISKDQINLKVGKSKDLDIKGVNAYVRWKSSNKKVAVVSSFGNVKAVGPGTTVISAKVKGKTLQCSVTVE